MSVCPIDETTVILPGPNGRADTLATIIDVLTHIGHTLAHIDLDAACRLAEQLPTPPPEHDRTLLEAAAVFRATLLGRHASVADEIARIRAWLLLNAPDELLPGEPLPATVVRLLERATAPPAPAPTLTAAAKVLAGEVLPPAAPTGERPPGADVAVLRAAGRNGAERRTKTRAAR